MNKIAAKAKIELTLDVIILLSTKFAQTILLCLTKWPPELKIEISLIDISLTTGPNEPALRWVIQGPRTLLYMLTVYHAIRYPILTAPLIAGAL